jgi:cation diffusion facilitator family transporter
MFHTKVGVAKLSVGSNTFLIIIKLAAGAVTGSVAVIAEAIHSLLDLVAAIIAYFSVRIAGHPADQEHPFGHGKAESISGFVEGALIFVAAGLIIERAITRMIEGKELIETTLGIVVMGVSVIVNTIVSRRLLKIARATDSMALEADAAHLYTDVYTSLGVFVGLIIVKITGLTILDSIAAIAVALLIIKAAWDIVHRSMAGLMDARLPASEEAVIREAIKEHSNEVVGFHALRTRKVGSQRDIDLHLVMAKDASLEVAHAMCDHLEQDICSKLSYATVYIHVEPCTTTECADCARACSRLDSVPVSNTPVGRDMRS